MQASSSSSSGISPQQNSNPARSPRVQSPGGGGGSEDAAMAGMGGGGSRPNKAQARQAAQALKGKYKDLEKRFDKQLKDNWGLETLVSVGESWLPAMLEQDEGGEANDVPVLKLFEFLVASICLFMIDDEQEPERREFELYTLSAPAGGVRGCVCVGGAVGYRLKAGAHPP